MQYVNLGKSGLKVSRLCLGMMSYGSKKWREWVLEEEEAKPFIERALERGINFFDTADIYSHGESEKILGTLLKHFGIKREQVVIATKVYQPISADVLAKFPPVFFLEWTAIWAFGISWSVKGEALEQISDGAKRLGREAIKLRKRMGLRFH